jgi:hypothetical protein
VSLSRNSGVIFGLTLLVFGKEAIAKCWFSHSCKTGRRFKAPEEDQSARPGLGSQQRLGGGLSVLADPWPVAGWPLL